MGEIPDCDVCWLLDRRLVAAYVGPWLGWFLCRPCWEATKRVA
jgi:hypothetical protein